MKTLLAVCLSFCTASPAAAHCRLALSLAIDVSSSIDEGEYALQKQGLYDALGAPEVVEGFLAVPGAWVTLHVYEWSGRFQQDVVLDWISIKKPGDLERARDTLLAKDRTYAEFPTALGYGVAFGTFAFREVPDCARRTIDVSGDGVNNVGFTARDATRSHDFTNTTVNGLVIGTDPELYTHYMEQVIWGPGAFVEVANDFSDYGRALERKLIRELGVLRLGQR